MLTIDLDQRYFNWLYSQIAPVRKKRSERTHLYLMEQLHETQFVAIVPHDENRIADAGDLKQEFLDEQQERGDRRWMRSPCSMFELLIILARQLAFEMDEEAEPWFWHLVETLEIEQFHDRNYDDEAREVIANTLDRVIWRTYSRNGHGGLFPLRSSRRDQRKIELWYQLNAFLLEQF